MGEITPPKAVPGLAEQISEKTSGFIHSRKHRDLLDIVDALRSNGVSHYVNLPKIISCGSQSSGKSSTLESFSGIAFPTAEGLCTRFATEVILRRSEKSETKVQIQLSASRSEEERVKLLKFHEKETDQKYFAKIIEAAKIEMGLTGTGPDAKVFSIDILRIESTSPTAPNLTLVDLPGLFSASDKNQHAFANQPVTKFAREIDPSGIRTLGLITKPDKIDRGSDTEKYYIELAQNNNVKLSLRSCVLCGLRLDALDPAQLGVSALRDRLREVLWKQIEGAMPGVKVEKYSVSLAADVAAAYHKVSLKRFIDNVSVNAVETCLVQQLPKVFSPDVAWELSDEQVELLGSEDDRTVTERAELQKKKAILTKALIYLDAVTARCGARGYKACFLAFFTPRTNSLYVPILYCQYESLIGDTDRAILLDPRRDEMKEALARGKDYVVFPRRPIMGKKQNPIGPFRSLILQSSRAKLHAMGEICKLRGSIPLRHGVDARAPYRLLDERGG
ncbi:hypothetical protein WAI453_006165 [Rhynchosporium graminicola]